MDRKKVLQYVQVHENLIERLEELPLKLRLKVIHWMIGIRLKIMLKKNGFSSWYMKYYVNLAHIILLIKMELIYIGNWLFLGKE